MTGIGRCSFGVCTDCCLWTLFLREHILPSLICSTWIFANMEQILQIQYFLPSTETKLGTRCHWNFSPLGKLVCMCNRGHLQMWFFHQHFDVVKVTPERAAPCVFFEHVVHLLNAYCRLITHIRVLLQTAQSYFSSLPVGQCKVQMWYSPILPHLHHQFLLQMLEKSAPFY